MDAPVIKGIPRVNELDPDSCTVLIRYNGISYGFLDFSMTVRNKSCDTLITGPASWSYVPFYSTLDSCVQSYPRLIRGIDPLERIVSLKKEKAELENEKNPYRGLSGIAISIVNQALTKGEDQKEQAARDMQKNADDWDAAHLQTINSMYVQIDFWRETALGKVVLAPKQEATGRILFPVEENAVEISVIVKVNGKAKATFFKQEIK
jgi:hypothetical protein